MADRWASLLQVRSFPPCIVSRKLVGSPRPGMSPTIAGVPVLHAERDGGS